MSRTFRKYLSVNLHDQAFIVITLLTDRCNFTLLKQWRYYETLETMCGAPDLHVVY